MAKKAKKKGMEVDQEYELVPIGGDHDILKEHPQNPRRGNVELIDESIDINGWYGVVTAQKSTGYIMAGNHRYRTALARGATEVPTVWRDVDDETALRICLADNRIPDHATYDEELLQELLENLETLDGTGWGLDIVAAEEDAEVLGGDDSEGDPEPEDDKYTPSWGVMVTCDSEEHQRKVYEELLAAGYELHVVAV